MSLANKVKPKIEKVINRFPTKAKVYEEQFNKYKEPLGEVLICESTGFYHEEKSRLGITLTDKGEVNRNNPEKYLMVLCNEETEKIKKDFILYLCDSNGEHLPGERYVIKDTGNLNKLNIYFDLNIKEANI